MRKKTSLDKFVVRSRRMMIYTFLLILVFMYIGAKAEMQKMRLPGGPMAEDGIGDQQDAGAMPGAVGEETEAVEEQREFFAWIRNHGRESRGETKTFGKNRFEQEAAEGENSGREDPGKENQGRENTGKEEPENGEPGKEEPRKEEPGGETGPMIREEDMWALILTNAKYPIPEDYSAELKVLPGTEQPVDARIHNAVVLMLSDMKAEGLHPIVCSAYRTLDRQEILFNRKVKNYVKRGYSMEDAYKEAQHVLSIPGSGEHCLGLAVDIYSQSYQKLEEGFENTKEGKWLREHCAEYGFILRYDRGKEDSTGINYEPWHFRYVGKEAAEYMMERGISLEEFYIEESLYG